MGLLFFLPVLLGQLFYEIGFLSDKTMACMIVFCCILCMELYKFVLKNTVNDKTSLDMIREFCHLVTHWSYLSLMDATMSR